MLRWAAFEEDAVDRRPKRPTIQPTPAGEVAGVVVAVVVWGMGLLMIGGVLWWLVSEMV